MVGLVKVATLMSTQTVSCSHLNKKWEKKWKFEWEAADLWGSNYLFRHTSCSSQTSHKISITHIIWGRKAFHIFSLSSEWAFRATHILAQRKTNWICNCVYLAWTLIPLHLKPWVSRRTTRQTSEFHPSPAIQNDEIPIKQTILKLQRFYTRPAIESR